MSNDAESKLCVGKKREAEEATQATSTEKRSRHGEPDDDDDDDELMFESFVEEDEPGYIGDDDDGGSDDTDPREAREPLGAHVSLSSTTRLTNSIIADLLLIRLR